MSFNKGWFNADNLRGSRDVSGLNKLEIERDGVKVTWVRCSCCGKAMIAEYDGDNICSGECYAKEFYAD